MPAGSMKGIPMLFEDGAEQQPFAGDTEAFYNQNNKSRGHHWGGPQPAIQSWDACLPDVGRGKEVFCSRQQTTARSGCNVAIV